MCKSSDYVGEENVKKADGSDRDARVLRSMLKDIFLLVSAERERCYAEVGKAVTAVARKSDSNPLEGPEVKLVLTQLDFLREVMAILDAVPNP